MRATIVLAWLFLVLPAAAQQPQQFRHFGEPYIRAARLVTLAPLCGLRDEAWARRLAQGVSATRDGVVPQGQREGLASAAFAVMAGTWLYETFGRAACPAADDAVRWYDADQLARNGATDQPPFPTLPEAVPRLAWQALVARAAVHCDLRDARWLNAALAGLRRQIALQSELAEDEAVRRGMATKMIDIAESTANGLYGMSGRAICPALRRNAALDAANDAATQWRRLCTARRPDPTCRLGRRP